MKTVIELVDFLKLTPNYDIMFGNNLILEDSCIIDHSAKTLILKVNTSERKNEKTSVSIILDMIDKENTQQYDIKVLDKTDGELYPICRALYHEDKSNSIHITHKI